METKGSIKMLTEVGMSAEEAKSKVDKMVKAINRAMKDDDEDAKAGVLNVKIKELARLMESVDRIPGICVAAGEMGDRNSYDKYKAKEAYKESPQQAVAEGIVDVIDGEPIALDTREFMDNAGTIPNKRYGKPLPVQNQRECLFVVDGEIVRTFGEINPEIGSDYVVFGKRNGGFINAKKIPAPMLKRVLDDDELWDIVDNVAASQENAVSVEEVLGSPVKKPYIIRGSVQYVGETSSGGYMLVLVDEGGESDGLVCFVNSDMADKYIGDKNIGAGNEVAVFGKTSVSKRDGEESIICAITGVIKNPASDKVSNVMSKLDHIMFE